jgi:hypothetical protein
MTNLGSSPRTFPHFLPVSVSPVAFEMATPDRRSHCLMVSIIYIPLQQVLICINIQVGFDDSGPTLSRIILGCMPCGTPEWDVAHT